jgi:hypothetical protein
MQAGLQRWGGLLTSCAAAWLLARGTAFADAPAPEPAPEQVGQGDLDGRRPTLLLMTEADGLEAEIVRAIATELNDVDLGLREIDMVAATELRDRIEAAEALTREHEALALIWIEARTDGLVVHLVVADAGMLRRPVVGFDDPREAIEVAAVIVRHFTTDLLAGRPIELTRFPPAPEPPGARVERPLADEVAESGLGPGPARATERRVTERGRLRLQAGYVGQTWVRERAWEHGVEINVGWRFPVGAHVGAGVAISPAFEVELRHPASLGVAQLRVRRVPVALVAGYQHVWAKPRLGLDAQLRLVSEVIERGMFDPAEVTPRIDRPVLVVPAIEPRVVLDYLAIPQLAVFVAVGARTSLARWDYEVAYLDEGGAVIGRERPLRAKLFAPVVLAGLDMFF